MGNRKEQILIVALHLFARDGYEAVSVSQIAGELDMTKGALYRHYKSKRDIFDCIVQRMEQQDGEQATEYDMPQEEKEKTPEKYETVSLDDFVEYSKSMFEYWTEDDFASSFRKMLTIEQFRSEEMQNLYQQYLVSGPTEYVKELFENMEINNPEENAVKFYANMFFYYSVYDGATDKAKAKSQFEQYAGQNCRRNETVIVFWVKEYEMGLEQWGASEQYYEIASVHPEYELGRVISQEKDLFRVVMDKEECLARVSGKFRYNVSAISEFPSVGDFVLVEYSFKGDVAVIHKVLPRKSVFIRKAAGKNCMEQVVAANIDTVFLCMALNRDFNMRPERYLSKHGQSRSVIILTKVDFGFYLEATSLEIEKVPLFARDGNCRINRGWSTANKTISAGNKNSCIHRFFGCRKINIDQ